MASSSRTLGTIKEKKEKKARNQVIAAADPAAPSGCAFWSTKSESIDGTGLTAIAKHNAYTESYSHIVNVQHDGPFTLKPLTITEGPLRGSHVLLVSPVQAFQFMQLPPEIRTIVYRYVFGELTFVLMSRRSLPTASKSKSNRKHGLRQIHSRQEGKKRVIKLNFHSPSMLSVLRVSKQVFREAAPIAYENIDFSFESSCFINSFLKTIGTMRKQLSIINLPCAGVWSTPQYTRTLTLLNDSTKLRRINVDHDTLCRNGYRQQSLESFLTDIVPLIKRIHDSRKARGLSGLSAVVHVDYKKCFGCASKSHVWECQQLKSGCGFKCGKDLEEHCKQVADRVWYSLVKQLDMEH